MHTDWSHWQPTIRATLLFIIDASQRRVLLIRKKRGLGAGKINGPGGKIDPGESAAQCAVRETQEELHVTAVHVTKHGELWFDFTDGMRMHVAVFLAHEHHGDPTETEEAIPLWTPIDALPLEEMWQDDRYWLSRLLQEESVFFTGRFQFDHDHMLSHHLDWTSDAWLDDRTI